MVSCLPSPDPTVDKEVDDEDNDDEGNDEGGKELGLDVSEVSFLSMDLSSTVGFKASELDPLTVASKLIIISLISKLVIKGT